MGLHFGALELPGLFLASRVGGAVAPMETIDDAALQAWFVRTRGAIGVRIVGLREARRELAAALRAGTSVGLVGDRDLTGGGTLTDAVRRAGAACPSDRRSWPSRRGRPCTSWASGGRHGWAATSAGSRPVDVPADGSRRERATATTAAIARAFERVIAVAPEQWWAVFFPIWPDLETAA